MTKRELVMVGSVREAEANQERRRHFPSDKGWLPEKSCCECGRRLPCIIAEALDALVDQLSGRPNQEAGE